MPELKQALVTGGTRGIGAAIAQALIDSGHRVTVTGKTSGPAPANCLFLKCDFLDAESLDALIQYVREEAPAVLINNAGINKVGLLVEYDPLDFARIQQVNATAPFLLCRAAIPGMQKRRFGRIVNISSVFGVVSKTGRSAYSASKFALFGMSRALAMEVASDNILVNCLSPGFVDTELTRRVLGPAGIAEMLRSVPIGRLAKPEEIARCVRFLASEENTYLTGQNVVVDGGFTAG